MENKTAITAAGTYRTATGRNLMHERITVAVGMRVMHHATYVARDGGELEGYRYGAVVRIGRGTEYGMHGTTAIAEVAWDAGGGHPDAGTITAIAVRMLRITGR